MTSNEIHNGNWGISGGVLNNSILVEMGEHTWVLVKIPWDAKQIIQARRSFAEHVLVSYFGLPAAAQRNETGSFNLI